MKEGTVQQTVQDEKESGALSNVTVSVLSTTIVEENEKDLEQLFAEEFMDSHPDIAIEFVGVPINYAVTQISTMAINENLPDIFVNLPEFRNKLSELDITVDLKEYVDPASIKKVHPFLMVEATVDDEIVFMPWSMVPMAVIYRSDWFEEKGLSVPEDWEAFLDTALSLTEDLDGDGLTDRWGMTLVGAKNNSGSVRFTNVLRSFGAYELRNEEGNWVTDIDSPQGMEALKYYGELYTRHRVVPPGPIEVSYEEAIEWMTEEKTAMMITGSHTMAALIAKNPDLTGKLGSFLIPKGQQHTSTLGIRGNSISKASSHKKEAALYLEFLLEKDNQIRWFQKTGRIPSTPEAGDEIFGRDNAYSGFYEAFNFVVPYPRVAYYADLVDILGQAYQSVLTESATPQAASQQAAKRVRQIIDNSN